MFCLKFKEKLRIYKTQKLHYNWFLLLFGKYKLRKDYIKFTANRYTKGVLLAKSAGYIPTDYDYLKKDYWIKQLKNDKNLHFKLIK